MRYFAYDEWDDDTKTSYVVTFSEDEIREKYYPYWLSRMNEKFGEEHVKQNYTFEDCLDDWVVVNWAWEVKE